MSVVSLVKDLSMKKFNNFHVFIMPVNYVESMDIP